VAIPEWEDMAIPEGFGPYRLLYNPPSETVIAQLRSIGDEFFADRLVVRKKNAEKYAPVAGSDLMVSSESGVTSLDRPLLFYLSNKLTRREERDSGDFEGLYSYDLQNRIRTKIADKDSLRLPAPYVEGACLYLTIGIIEPDNQSGFRAVHYQLGRMEVETGRIDLLSRLKGAFF
jgi:hypothetical protein